MHKPSNKLHKVIVPISVLALFGGLISGCSQSAGNRPVGDGAKTEAGKTNALKKITMMNVFFTAEPPKADSDAMKLVEKVTQTKWEVTWIPDSAYHDKATAAIASGELPQVMLIKTNAIKSVPFVNAVRSGMFWEVGPYIKQYPNLSKIHDIVLENASIDGKVYGIPRLRPLTRDGIIIRKDWLDNLGLKEPKTVDDLINVIKAFTLNDPDMNGKNDTYGFAAAGVTGFKHFLGYYGGPNNWEVKDGKLVPEFMVKPYMDVLKLYRQMYEAKYFNQDFAVVKISTELINKGKAGIFFGPMDDVTARFSELYKQFPNAKLDVLSRIEGPTGVKVMAGSGYNSIFAFPKTSIKSEAQLKDIFERLDKLGEKVLQDMRNWGFEGKHYRLENGKPMRINEKQFTVEVYTHMFQMKFDDDSLAMRGIEEQVVEKYKKMMDENVNIAVSDPTEPLISNTNTEKGSELDKIIDDARIKFIMGDIDEAGLNKAVEQWRKQGGDKITEEYNAEFAKVKKKKK